MRRVIVARDFRVVDGVKLATDLAAADPEEFCGPPGPRGADGALGAEGPRGARGQQGDPGPQGDLGPQGSSGDEGPRGPLGPRGATGAASTEPGPQGTRGPQGTTGLRGVDGDASTVPGPEGPEGPHGSQGIQGAKGLKGNEGEQGPRGLRGLRGYIGDTGASGTGAQGPAGPQGSAGAQGADGAAGATGGAGAQGPAGPQGGDGADSTVPGPAGPDGPEGPAGPQGGDGADSTVPGPAGPDGPEGPEGPAGADSTVPGPQGPAGPTTWAGITDKPATFAPIIGGGAGDAVAGNDARLTDARAPTAHAAAHNDGGSDELAVVDALAAHLADAAAAHGAGAIAIVDAAGDFTATDVEAALAELQADHEADLAAKGAASGYASLDAGTKVPIAEVPTGQTGATVPFGNDARFTDARAPTAHATAHNDGGADALAEDAAAATASLRSLGTGATQAASGTDARLSDSRTAIAHALVGALHTLAGGTAGFVLRAIDATSFAWARLNHSDLTLDATHPNDHANTLDHARAHDPVAAADHPVSGLTPNDVLTALTATTIGWAAPAGGGGGGPTKISGNTGAFVADTTWETLTADSSGITSTTQTTVMTITGLGPGTYRVKGTLIWKTALTTTGIGITLNHTGTLAQFVSTWWTTTTGGAAATGIADQVTAVAAGQLLEGKSERVKDTRSSFNVGTDTNLGTQLSIIEAILIVTVSGDLQLKIATEVSASAATLLAGSTLEVNKVV